MSKNKRRGVSPNVNKVVLYDPKNMRIMDLDPVNGGILPTVSAKETMIHRGSFFTATVREEKMVPSKPKYVFLRAPDTLTRVHITGETTTNKVTTINLYECPMVDPAGTIVQIFNNDRNSEKKATLVIQEDPLPTDLGKLLLTADVEGHREPANEIVLRQNARYLIEIKPQMNQTDVVLVITWYEEDP